MAVIYGTSNNNNLFGYDNSHDQIYGLEGNDVLHGGSASWYVSNTTSLTSDGVDTLYGGMGDDVYYVRLEYASLNGGYLFDSVVEDADSGFDLVYLFSPQNTVYTLSANVEAFGFLSVVSSVQATGNALDNIMNGGDLDDGIIGLGGNDWLNGGLGRDVLRGGDGNDHLDEEASTRATSNGVDTMYGGAGDDVYWVDDPGDLVVELLNEGWDTVYFKPIADGSQYILPSNVDGLLFVVTGWSASLIGNALNNYIAGTIGSQSIFGGAGDDTLIGGVDSDALDGGVGFDTAELYIASTSITWRHTSQRTNGWTATNGAEVDTLSNIESAHFTNGDVALRQARSNFNFGGTNDVGSTSDLLLRDGAGNVLDWTMQNNGVAAGSSIGGAFGWTVLGTGDFNADGCADVLLRSNSTNAVAYWSVNNGLFSGSALISSNSSGYGYVGTGDIDNNGATDIVLQNGSLIAAWKNINGVAIGVAIGTAVGYGADAVGDINADGSADIIMHDASGNLVAWLLNGSGQISTGVLIAGGLSGYGVAGVGDFNGDGTTDILLRQFGTGYLVDLQMANGAISQVHNLGYSLGAIAGLGDYNGDGTADIAFQNGGTVQLWNMANGFVTGTTLVTDGLTGYIVQG
jgi:hypothetical protein